MPTITFRVLRKLVKLRTVGERQAYLEEIGARDGDIRALVDRMNRKRVSYDQFNPTFTDPAIKRGPWSFLRWGRKHPTQTRVLYFLNHAYIKYQARGSRARTEEERGRYRDREDRFSEYMSRKKLMERLAGTMTESSAGVQSDPLIENEIIDYPITTVGSGGSSSFYSSSTVTTSSDGNPYRVEPQHKQTRIKVGPIIATIVNLPNLNDPVRVISLCRHDGKLGLTSRGRHINGVRWIAETNFDQLVSCEQCHAGDFLATDLVNYREFTPPDDDDDDDDDDGIRRFPAGAYARVIRICPQCVTRTQRRLGTELRNCSNCQRHEFVDGTGVPFVTNACTCREPQHQPPNVHNYTTNVLSIYPDFIVGDGEQKLSTSLYLGIELEVEVRPKHNPRHIADRVAERLSGFAILKRDSSISPNRGFEIVTVPATWKGHVRMWRLFFDDCARYVRGWDTSNCGMHIHINRSAMTTLHQGKLLSFINSDENGQFITDMAGRGASEYCKRNKKEIKDIKAQFEHHDALSISNKNRSRTLELRIFRSNVRESGFFKNVEFTVAAIEFTRFASPNELSWSKFIQWMDRHENRQTYQNLARWLVMKKYITAVKRVEKEGVNESEFAA